MPFLGEYQHALDAKGRFILPARFSFFVDGETTCSGLVARAQERTGAIFNRATVNITPADLAKYYRV